MKYVLFILSLLPTLSFAQDLGCVHPVSSSNDFTQIEFIGTTGYINAQKFLLKTKDDGETWKPVYNSIIREFENVDFVTKSKGYAYAGNTVYKTEDGGSAWNAISGNQVFGTAYFSVWDSTHGTFMHSVEELVKILIKDGYSDQLYNRNGYRSGSSVTGISFINENEGVAIGNQGRISKTTNGYYFSEKFSDYERVRLTGIVRLNSSVILVCGHDGTMVKSIDAGDTWTEQDALTHNDLSGFAVVDENTVYAYGPYNIFKSDDAGDTWSEIEAPRGHKILSLSKNSNGDFFIGSERGGLLKSTDECLTWFNLTSGSNTFHNAVTYLGNSTLIAVGDKGSVYKSTDNGVNWERKTNPIFYNLETVSSYGDLVAAVGYQNKVYMSSDAGETWFIGDGGSYRTLNGVLVLDASTIIAVGDNGEIIKSSDGGVSWKNVSSLLSQDLYGIGQSNNGKLVAGGDDGLVMVSNDVGETWTIIDGPHTSYDTKHCYAYNDMLIISANHSSGSAYRSYDEGETWKYTSISGSKNYKKFAFEDDSTWTVIDVYGRQYRTTDSAKTWVKEIEAETQQGFYDIVKIDDQNLVSVGANGLSYSADSGKTWTIDVYNEFSDMMDIKHASENVVFACGGSYILKSTNGGVSWKATHYGISAFALHFFDENHGIAAGGNGGVYSTSNSGETWESVTSLYGTTIYDIDFLDNLNGVMVGSGGKIYTTSDGGKTWAINIHSETTSTLRQVSYVSASNIVAVGGSRDIFYSTDTGATWKSFVIDYFSVPDFESVDFFNDKVGVAIGSANNYKTTDGGKTWVTTGVDHYEAGQVGTEIQCVNEYEGYILGERGKMYWTNDQGESWQEIKCPASTNLNAMSYYSYRNLVVAGDFGTILKDQLGIVTFVEEAPKSEGNLVVFPNPFTEELNLDFGLDSPGSLSFELYDIQGKLVSSQKLITANQIKIQLEANLKSGSYFYKISSAQKVYTGKLVRK